jgi:hypothetical protein
LMQIWCDRCDPPLDESELRESVQGGMYRGTERATKTVDEEDGPPNAAPQSLDKFTFRELKATYPTMSPPVVDRLIREGETCNIISYSKIGKSWLAYGLALSVITGRPWLDRFATSAGQVLYIDNELQRSNLASRIPAVGDSMGITTDMYEDKLEIWPLRGNLRSLKQLSGEFANVEHGMFKLIILDAAYRFFLEGTSENDNAAMAQFYNELDRIACATGAAVALVHHTTKGNQSNKRVTDVGAGAGAQSRAADCHLVLREHEEAQTVVLDGAVRSFAPVEPMTLKWEYPLWTPSEADPAQLKAEPTRSSRRQAANDVAGILTVTQVLQEGPATATQLRKRTGLGRDRVERLIGQMTQRKLVKVTKTKVRGHECEQYALSA